MNYTDNYFYLHDTHILDTVANTLQTVLKDTVITTNPYNRTLTICGDVNQNTLQTVLNQFNNTVHYTDTDNQLQCTKLYFRCNLVDVEFP